MTEKTIILDSENFHHLLEAQEVKKKHQRRQNIYFTVRVRYSEITHSEYR